MAFSASALVFLMSMVASTTASPNTTEIAPGVFMPYINLGGVASRPSNYTAWFEAGGRGVDTALTYGLTVQMAVGKAVGASKLPRDQAFVTTKVPCCPTVAWGGVACNSSFFWHSTTLQEDLEADLQQLGLAYVDLMLLHWPCTTVAETAAAYKAMEPLVASGKARAIGISNFNTSMIAALLSSGIKVRPSINQCGFSIAGHNDSTYGSDFQTLEACRKAGITYSAYSPLGGLSGVNVLGDIDVKRIAAKYGKSAAQVALRWVIQQGVVAVTSSSKIAYDKQDLDIFDFELTKDEMALLAKK